MKATGILISVLLAAVPPAYADGAANPRVAVDHRGHDHAAMMQGMGKAAWTLYPTLKARASGKDRATMRTVVLQQNIVATEIDAWSNDLEDERGHRQLPVEMGGAMLDKSSGGGFHWLAAREEQGAAVRVASTVLYSGERGAHNPTAMFMQQKHELEIIPQPHPREHARYRANEDWQFVVRFNGQPLAGHKVYLETSNGSMTEFVSDAQGVVRVHVPDDFKTGKDSPASGGHDHGMRRTGEFVLATEHAEGGKDYLTAFNSSYGPDAYDQRSLALGVGFTLLGMLGAAPLLRRRKGAKKNEEAAHA